MNNRGIIEFFKKRQGKKYTFEQLMRALRIGRNKGRHFRKVLQGLLRDGILVMQGKFYSLPSLGELVSGKVIKHSRGFAFVVPDDKKLNDVFLNRREAQSLMNNDYVQVSANFRKDGSSNGKLVKILERGQKQIVGVLVKEEKHFFVIPYGTSAREEMVNKLFIPPKSVGGASDGEVVVAKIKRYPAGRRLGDGEIVSIIGESGDPSIDTDIIICKHELPSQFPGEVIAASKSVPVTVTDSDLKSREDLRDLPFVTIDNETARDFDDAIFVKKHDSGFTLWVAIADVSHYVEKNSPIDMEALNRGTSVYFPDRVVPMLPEVLSNEICSLKPNVDRLTFTCEMRFDSYGNRVGTKIYESVIRSFHRLTYGEVFKMINGDSDVLAKYSSYAPHLNNAVELYRLLKKRRADRGGLDFDLPEAQLVLDVRGKIEQIIKTPRTDANMLIEEFMISANEAVAEIVEESKTPGIYRVHEPPSQESLALLQGLLLNIGYNCSFKEGVRPKELGKIINWVSGKGAERLVNTVLLRSMKQALYQRENMGHFGLASRCYSHFTSPIRRYPDLILHRLLKNLKKTPKPADRELGYLQSMIDDSAKQSSVAERRAMGAEREVVKLKKCRFMMDKVGNEYWGYIEGITDFGMFIELEDWFIEGLVRFLSLKDDIYIFVEEEYVARGERTNNKFKLGDKVKIRVDAVKIYQREIDFTLLERA